LGCLFHVKPAKFASGISDFNAIKHFWDVLMRSLHTISLKDMRCCWAWN